MTTQTTDPRIDPMAKFICQLFDDSWTPNKKSYRAWARNALRIADEHAAPQDTNPFMQGR